MSSDLELLMDRIANAAPPPRNASTDTSMRERALKRAEVMIDTYVAMTPSQGQQENHYELAMIDMVADLMHIVQREGLDMDEILRFAREGYNMDMESSRRKA